MVLQGKTAYNNERWESSKGYYENAKIILENIKKIDPKLNLSTLKLDEINIILNNIENEVRKSNIYKLVKILIIVLVIFIILYLACKVYARAFEGLKTKIIKDTIQILVIMVIFILLVIIIILVVKGIININSFLNI